MIRIENFKAIYLSKNPFDYLNNTKISNNVELQDFGRSFFSFTKTFIISFIATTAIVLAADYAYTKSGKKREEVKEKITHKFLIVVLLFAFPFLMSTLYTVVKSLI
jgi:hypothetical protein